MESAGERAGGYTTIQRDAEKESISSSRDRITSHIDSLHIVLSITVTQSIAAVIGTVGALVLETYVYVRTHDMRVSYNVGLSGTHTTRVNAR